MHYTFLSSLLSSPWLIDANTFNSVYPLFNGMLNGLAFQAEGEPKNAIPFHVSAATKAAVVGVSSQENNQKLIHVLPVRGVLTKHDQPCGPVGTRTLGQRFSKADANPDVIGHIILGESGGGQAIAVPELTEQIQKSTKPILGYIDGISASAMYYIHSYCTEIMASRETDIVGSTGTMIAYEGRKAVSSENKDGVVHVRIYADGSEEKNIEYEEAINNNNFKLVKENILNPHREQFVADIKSNRPNVTEKQLKAGIMQAKDAIGTFIDSIGTFDDAISRLLELAGYKEEDQAQANSNQKSNNMPKLSALVALLAVASIELNDGGAHLTEEQLESINSALENKELNDQLKAALDAQATAEGERDAANTKIAELTEQVANLQKSNGSIDKKLEKTSDDDLKGQSEHLTESDRKLFNLV